MTEPIVTVDPAVLEGLEAWRSLPIKQQPQWTDADALERVTSELAKLPPLVFAGEVDQLTDRLARVARGDAFLLQGGDCAETFDVGHVTRCPHCDRTLTRETRSTSWADLPHADVLRAANAAHEARR